MRDGSPLPQYLIREIHEVLLAKARRLVQINPHKSTYAANDEANSHAHSLDKRDYLCECLVPPQTPAKMVPFGAEFWAAA